MPVRPTSFPELIENVNRGNGIRHFKAEILRDAYGADRLGVIVRQRISDLLRSQGYATIPALVPDRADEPVMVYRIDSQVGRIIQATTVASVMSSKTLRDASKAADNLEAAAKWDKVRKLVLE